MYQNIKVLLIWLIWYCTKFDWNFYLLESQWFLIFSVHLWPYGRFQLWWDWNVGKARTKILQILNLYFKEIDKFSINAHFASFFKIVPIIGLFYNFSQFPGAKYTGLKVTCTTSQCNMSSRRPDSAKWLSAVPSRVPWIIGRQTHLNMHDAYHCL